MGAAVVYGQGQAVDGIRRNVRMAARHRIGDMAHLLGRARLRLGESREVGMGTAEHQAHVLRAGAEAVYVKAEAEFRGMEILVMGADDG